MCKGKNGIKEAFVYCSMKCRLATNKMLDYTLTQSKSLESSTKTGTVVYELNIIKVSDCSNNDKGTTVVVSTKY